jgi:hypothetical protein
MLESLFLPGCKLLLFQVSQKVTSPIKFDIAVDDEEGLLKRPASQQESRGFVHVQASTSHNKETWK